MRLDVQAARSATDVPPADAVLARHLDDLLPAVYVDTGRTCNQDCIYCSVDKHSPAPVSVEEIHATFAAASSAGLSRLVFIGGEPTVRDDLPRLVADARERGFDVVSVMTNGVRLADRERLRALVDAGLSHLQLSLDDQRWDQQAALARRPSTERLLPRALDNLLAEESLGLSFYHVMTRVNAAALPDFVRFLGGLRQRSGRELVTVSSFVKPVTTAWENREAVVPKLSEVVGPVRQALELASSLGVPFYFRNLQECVLPGLGAKNVDSYTSVRSLDSASGRYEPMDHDDDFARVDRCQGCPHEGACPGVYRAYLELHGDAEFRDEAGMRTARATRPAT